MPWCWSFRSSLSKHSIGTGWTLGRPDGKCGRAWPSGSWDIIQNHFPFFRTVQWSRREVLRTFYLVGTVTVLTKVRRREENCCGEEKSPLFLSLSLSHTHTHTPRAISQSHWIVFNKGKLAECQLWEVAKDREAWRAVVHGVVKSQTRPSNWTTTPSKGKLAEGQNFLPPPTGCCFLFSENSE